MNRIFRLAASLIICAICLFISSVKHVHVVTAQDFDICLQDDGNGSATLRFNSSSGDYEFCSSKTFSGKGSITKQGKVVTLKYDAPDRKLSVFARVNTDSKSGSASLQAPRGEIIDTIRDSNTGDSKCGCQ